MESIKSKTQKTVNLQSIESVAEICPYCGQKFKIEIDKEKIGFKEKSGSGMYYHLYLHGNPKHGILCFLDANLTIRSLQVIKSLEIKD